MLMHRRTGAALSLAAALTATTLTACGSGGSSADPDAVHVATSFYPLTYAVQQIGGHHVDVTSLTPNGAEPHGYELTPSKVEAANKADLLVYAQGFQASVDQTVRSVAEKTAYDVAPAAGLDLSLDDVDQVAGRPEDDDDTHGTDPHFWLDPVRYAKVADAIASRLEKIDPAHRTAYRKGAKRFTDKLRSLNKEFHAGLAHCDSTDLVTSHAAFGYLAQRYGFKQIGVSGIAPDQMPTPRRLAAVSRFVTAHDVQTIYSETLASPAVAETIARQTGAKVTVLDPIEGITDDSAGSTYFEVMRSDLKTLRTHQGCH